MSKLGIGLVGMLLCGLAAVAVRYVGADEAKPESSVLRHVVFFRFNEGLEPAKLQEIVDAFRALPGKIDVIKDFEWGTDVGVENLADGYTHCFFVTFADEKGRDAYLPHPAHQEFVTLVKPHLAKVCVIDYWAKH